MTIAWLIVGALGGLLAGAILGFLAALGAMSFAQARTDGTFGMQEVLFCVPAGAVLGLLAGVWWTFDG